MVLMNEIKDKNKKYCWAKGEERNHECNGEITKEHVISKSILEHIGKFQFIINDKKIIMGKQSHVITNLCRHHNNALRKCDSEALKLFSGWHRFLTNKKTIHPEAKSNKIQINTKLIEAWYAKTLINTTIFRERLHNLKTLTLPPPIDYMRAEIFDNKRFSPPFGIYMLDPKKSLLKKRHAWEIGPQFVKFVHESAKTKLLIEIYIPCALYTCIGAIEIVGFFNFTGFSDKDALNTGLKQWAERLNQDGIYRTDINFSTTHKIDNDYDGKTPTRFIEFID